MRHFSSGFRFIFVFLSLFCAATPRAQGLSAPTLRATADGHTVALQWTDAEGYRTNRIERKSDGSDWTLVAETSMANSYWDRTTVGGVTYTYRVQAITLDGRFTYSNEASATTASPPPAPVFNADVSFNNIRLRWLPSDGVTSYEIESADTTPGTWRELVTLNGNTTEYLITPLIEGKTYYYRIRAFNPAGSSPFSTLHATAPYNPNVIPPAPTIHGFTQSDTSISLQWTYIPQAWGYHIDSSTEPIRPMDPAHKRRPRIYLRHPPKPATLHPILLSHPRLQRCWRIRLFSRIHRLHLPTAARLPATPRISRQLQRNRTPLD